MARRYPKEVHDFIKQNVEGRTTRELVALVNARFGEQLFTEGSMKSYKANHKLKSGTPSGIPRGAPTELYPEHITKYIQENYSGIAPSQMAGILNAKFGTNYSPQQLSAYYKNHKIAGGVNFRFQKGHVPPNKGKKGYYSPGCEKGWFAKGHTPSNKLPVGTVMRRSDGYMYRKIGEGPLDWRQEHVIVWEEVNGPVPEGHVLIFKDGDRTNTVLDNLVLATNKVNLQMNRRGLRFEDPALTEVGIQIAKVQVAAFERQRELKGKK